MKTLAELGATLKARSREMKVTQLDLHEQAGISRQTLANVFSGRADFRVTTLLALADSLGLEMVLVPQAAAAALSQGATRPSAVKTAVQAAQERLNLPSPPLPPRPPKGSR